MSSVFDISSGAPWSDKGGEPPDNGVMEARVAKLEAGVSHIERDIGDLRSEMRQLRQEMTGLRSDQRSDFRLTFGALIAVALGLAGLMAKGFHWL